MKKATRFRAPFSAKFVTWTPTKFKVINVLFMLLAVIPGKKVFPNSKHYWKTKIKLCSGILESCWQYFQGRIREFYSVVSLNTWAPGSEIFSWLILLHLRGQSRCVYLEFLVPRLSFRRSSTPITIIKVKDAKRFKVSSHTCSNSRPPKANFFGNENWWVSRAHFNIFLLFWLGFSEIQFYIDTSVKFQRLQAIMKCNLNRFTGHSLAGKASVINANIWVRVIAFSHFRFIEI